MTAEPERDDNGFRRSLSPFRRNLMGVLFLSFLLLFALALRRTPPDVLPRLREARPFPVFLGMTLYGLAFLTRGVRLNLLLPRDERLPVLRAASLSAAATFFLQVIPFRGGEIAGWAAYRRALGSGWGRAGAVFALVKVVDSASVLLLGLGGAAFLAARRGAPVLGAATAALVALGAVALLLMPRLGARLVVWIYSKMKSGRLQRVAEEVAEALEVSARAPGAYFLSVAFALVFLALYVAAMYLVCEGLGVPVSFAGLSFAALTSITTAALIPSPAGTFGPNESGFAAGLAFDGLALGTGVITGAALHVLFTATAGLVALPFLFPAKRAAE